MVTGFDLPTALLSIAQVWMPGLPSPHFVIGGPNCQPFSAQGAHQSWDDPRSDTMVSCCDCIVDQATRAGSVFIGFLLENVPGMLHRRGSDTSPAQEVLATLAQQLGSSFEVWCWQVNAANLGVPQSRERIYFAGRRVCKFHRSLPSLNPGKFCIKGFGLRAMLDSSLDPVEPNTQRQKSNLEWYLARAAEHISQLPKDSVLICDLSRGDGVTRDPVYTYDTVPTITTSSRHIYVHGLADDLPRYHRYITAEGRCLLQGFAPSLVDRLGRSQVTHALGNAMSVNAVGICFAALVQDYRA